MNVPDYDRAATLAALTLIKLNVDKLPVFPEKLIRQCKNTRVMTYAEYCMLPHIAKLYPDAITYKHPEALTHLFELQDGSCAWLVYYDPQMLKGARWKFSFAHELGHIVMRHHGHSQIEEMEADFFASHLLIPRALIAELNERNIPLLEVNISNLTNVSKACIWTMQQSQQANVNPKYNSILRKRMKNIVDSALDLNILWQTPHRLNTLYNFSSYMQGYE